MARDTAGMSTHDYDVAAEKKAAKKKKKLKTLTANDASGDGSLFQDEAISHAKKPKKAEAPAPAKSKFEFKGFDPNNSKKLGKKKGHKAFKSKAKHKRR
jgi:hypothetical protein